MAGHAVYRCSDGRYYGDVDVWERLESGAWRPFCWDEETGEEWMMTRDERLLVLTPVFRSSLPEEVPLERVDGGVSVPTRAGCPDGDG